MKIESERCKALKSTIETLCTGENTAFYSVFKKVSISTLEHAAAMILVLLHTVTGIRIKW